MKLPVKTTINGQNYSHEVEPRLLLVHYIRETVGLTGTHVGCDTSQCGACTILMDGKAVNFPAATDRDRAAARDAPPSH